MTLNLGVQWNRLSGYSFSLVSIFVFGFTFLKIFFFAAILDKESFGKIFLITTLFSTFSYLSVFGLDTTIFKYYFDKKFEKMHDLQVAIFHTWLLLSAGLLIILLPLGYILITYFQFD